jgi:hypothetical protein
MAYWPLLRTSSAKQSKQFTHRDILMLLALFYPTPVTLPSFNHDSRTSKGANICSGEADMAAVAGV